VHAFAVPRLNGAAAEPVPRLASRAAFHAKRECCLSSNPIAGLIGPALTRLPQRDRDDFEFSPTDSSRVVDVVPMHGVHRGRAERRFRCSSEPGMSRLHEGAIAG
jgi:hypothetical protein